MCTHQNRNWRFVVAMFLVFCTGLICYRLGDKGFSQKQSYKSSILKDDFYDQMSETNVILIRGLEADLKTFPEEDVEGRACSYRQWKIRFDEVSRSLYVRYNKPLPAHLQSDGRGGK